MCEKPSLCKSFPYIARMKVDAEPLGDDPLEIDASPAHDAIFPTLRAGLDDLRKLSQLLRRQTRPGAIRPVVDEALRTRGVEAMDPVAQRLPVHGADLRRPAAIHAIADRGKQQSRRLWLTSFDRRANARRSSTE